MKKKINNSYIKKINFSLLEKMSCSNCTRVKARHLRRREREKKKKNRAFQSPSFPSFRNAERVVDARPTDLRWFPCVALDFLSLDRKISTLHGVVLKSLVAFKQCLGTG